MRQKLFSDAIGDRVALSKVAHEIALEYTNLLPSSEQLKSLSDRYDTNTATLVLDQSLRAHQVHGEFINQVEASSVSASKIPNPPRLVVVPGLFYDEHPELGSDAALIIQIARQFGIPTELVPTKSRGSIAENTEILHRYLLENDSAPYWLASISRGGSEIKWLLSKYHTEAYLDSLCGWVSVNGVVRGTRLVDGMGAFVPRRWLLHCLARISRVNTKFVNELDYAHTQWAPTTFPAHAHYINVISLPMSWDLTASLQTRYRILSTHGPNDGTVVLSDYLSEPGLCIPMLGVDHMLRSSNLSALFYQLINRLLVDPTRMPTLLS